MDAIVRLKKQDSNDNTNLYNSKPISQSIILTCGMWDAINVGLLFFLVGSQNLWNP
jgi:hypothetical protein